MKPKIIAVAALVLVIAATAHTWLSPKVNSKNPQPETAQYIYDNPLYKEEQSKAAAESLSVKEFNRIQLERRKQEKRVRGKVKPRMELLTPTIIDATAANAPNAFDGDDGTYADCPNDGDYILIDLGAVYDLDHITERFSADIESAGRIYASDAEGTSGDLLISFLEDSAMNVDFDFPPDSSYRYLKFVNHQAPEAISGSRLYTLEIYAITPQPKPEHVAATPGKTKIAVTWRPGEVSPGVESTPDSFTVKRRVAGGGSFTELGTVTNNGTNYFVFFDEAADEATEYDYVVSQTEDGTESDDSDIATAQRTESDDSVDRGAVNTVAVQSQAVSTAPTDRNDFEIYDSTGAVIASYRAGADNSDGWGATAGGTGYVVIVPPFNAPVGKYFVIQSSAGGVFFDTSTVPPGHVAVTRGKTQIAISWRPGNLSLSVESNPDSFTVKRREESEETFTVLGTVANDGTTPFIYFDTTAEAATGYYYVVSQTEDGAESDDSTAVPGALLTTDLARCKRGRTNINPTSGSATTAYPSRPQWEVYSPAGSLIAKGATSATVDNGWTMSPYSFVPGSAEPDEDYLLILLGQGGTFFLVTDDVQVPEPFDFTEDGASFTIPPLVTGAAKYRLDIMLSPGGNFSSYGTGVEGDTIVVEGLAKAYYQARYVAIDASDHFLENGESVTFSPLPSPPFWLSHNTIYYNVTDTTVSIRPLASDNITIQIRLEYRAVGDTEWLTAGTATPYSSVTASGLIPGEVYEFRGIAINNSGESDPSATDTYQTLPPTPDEVPEYEWVSPYNVLRFTAPNPLVQGADFYNLRTPYNEFYGMGWTDIVLGQVSAGGTLDVSYYELNRSTVAWGAKNSAGVSAPGPELQIPAPPLPALPPAVDFSPADPTGASVTITVTAPNPLPDYTDRLLLMVVIDDSTFGAWGQFAAGESKTFEVNPDLHSYRLYWRADNANGTSVGVSTNFGTYNGSTGGGSGGSDPETAPTVAPANFRITTPDTDTTPSFAWDYVAPNSGDTQGAYQLRIWSGGTYVYDSGKVSSSGATATVPTALGFGNYIAYLHTWDQNDRVSPDATLSFSLRDDTPVVPPPDAPEEITLLLQNDVSLDLRMPFVPTTAVKLKLQMIVGTTWTDVTGYDNITTNYLQVTVAGLTANTRYKFRAVAVNSEDVAVAGPEDWIYTTPTSTVTVLQPPAPPSAASKTPSVKIRQSAWQNTQSSMILRRDGNAIYTFPAANTGPYEDEDAYHGAVYTLVARNAAGDSPASQPFTLSLTSSLLSIAWQEPATNATLGRKTTLRAVVGGLAADIASVRFELNGSPLPGTARQSTGNPLQYSQAFDPNLLSYSGAIPLAAVAVDKLGFEARAVRNFNIDHSIAWATWWDTWPLRAGEQGRIEAAGQRISELVHDAIVLRGNDPSREFWLQWYVASPDPGPLANDAAYEELVDYSRQFKPLAIGEPRLTGKDSDHTARLLLVATPVETLNVYQTGCTAIPKIRVVDVGRLFVFGTGPGRAFYFTDSGLDKIEYLDDEKWDLADATDAVLIGDKLHVVSSSGLWILDRRTGAVSLGGVTRPGTAIEAKPAKYVEKLGDVAVWFFSDETGTTIYQYTEKTTILGEYDEETVATVSRETLLVFALADGRILSSSGELPELLATHNADVTALHIDSEGTVYFGDTNGKLWRIEDSGAVTQMSDLPSALLAIETEFIGGAELPRRALGIASDDLYIETQGVDVPARTIPDATAISALSTITTVLAAEVNGGALQGGDDAVTDVSLVGGTTAAAGDAVIFRLQQTQLDTSKAARGERIQYAALTVTATAKVEAE